MLTFNVNQLVRRIYDLQDEHRILVCKAREGAPYVIEQLLADGTSLRQLARRLNLSPTYLSRVRNRKIDASLSLFVRLATSPEKPENSEVAK